jgi:hypothetical protein
MRFYNTQHQFYGGIDLHARSLSVGMLNQDGEIMIHRHMKTNPDAFLKVIAPYRADLVIAVECVFTWDLAGRPLRSRGHSLRAGAGALHEGHARGQGQKRPH